MPGKTSLKIFLCGDVMTGRGIDQILVHSAEPQLYESYIKNARDYVLLAKRTNGTIPPVCPWLELISFERINFKLNYANDEDCQWLFNALQKQSAPFNTHFKLRKNIISL